MQRQNEVETRDLTLTLIYLYGIFLILGFAGIIPATESEFHAHLILYIIVVPLVGVLEIGAELMGEKFGEG